MAVLVFSEWSVGVVAATTAAVSPIATSSSGCVVILPVVIEADANLAEMSWWW